MAIDRAYTIKEIDELRRVVDRAYLFGPESFRKNWKGGSSGGYNRAEKERVIEERLRTYMTAGVVAEDLIKEYSRES